MTILTISTLEVSRHLYKCFWPCMRRLKEQQKALKQFDVWYLILNLSPSWFSSSLIYSSVHPLTFVLSFPWCVCCLFFFCLAYLKLTFIINTFSHLLHSQISHFLTRWRMWMMRAHWIVCIRSFHVWALSSSVYRSVCRSPGLSRFVDVLGRLLAKTTLPITKCCICFLCECFVSLLSRETNLQFNDW